MKEKIKHIDQIARKKLLDAKAEPPLSAWDDLVKDLDQINSKRKTILYRKISAVAAAIIILIGLGFIFLTPTDVANRVVAIQTPIDSTQNEASEIDSLTLKSDSIYKPKQTTTKFIAHTETIKPSIATPKKRVKITYLKMLNLTIPINSNYQSSILIAENNFSNKKSTFVDRVVAYESIPKQTIAQRKNWKFGLGYSPSYSTINSPTDGNFYRANAPPQSGIDNNDEILDVNDQLIPSLTFGVNFAYNLSDRWSIVSGVYYLNQKNEIQNFYVIENTANATSELSTNSSLGNIQFSKNEALINGAGIYDGFTSLSSYMSIANSNFDLIQSFEFIEIPFLISFKFLNNNYSIALIGGLNTGFLVSNKVYLKNHESENIGTTDDINNLIFKSVIGFSFEYPLTKRLFLTVAPTYKYQLNNLNNASVKNHHLQFFDIKTGISYQF